MVQQLKYYLKDNLENISAETEKTGYSLLDNAGYDFPLGKLSLVTSVAGHPLQTILLSFATTRTVDHSEKTCFITLGLYEPKDLASKIVAQITSFSLSETDEGLTLQDINEHYDSLEDNDLDWVNAPLYIDQQTDGNIKTLTKKVKSLAVQTKCDMIIISRLDYLFIQNTTLSRGDEIRVCLSKLKKLARELNIAIVLGGVVSSESNWPTIPFKEYITHLLNNFIFIRKSEIHQEELDHSAYMNTVLEVTAVKPGRDIRTFLMPYNYHNYKLENKVVHHLDELYNEK